MPRDCTAFPPKFNDENSYDTTGLVLLSLYSHYDRNVAGWQKELLI
jgi:hypothetical protein